MKHFVLVVGAALMFSASALPAYAFEVSGWIPYWAVAKGTHAARTNLDAFTSINPFAYSVRTDGSLGDTAGLSKSAWKKLFKEARAQDVAIVPTIMWSDRTNIEKILSNPTLRAQHVKRISALVEKHDFDGIDIDYENKSASTRPHFSAFLKELKAVLGTKTLACTIEARTPPDSLYRTIPTNLEYVNDYKEINKHCDQVRIMAYDQQTADWKLNTQAKGPYAPLSDIAWVRKVVELASKDISREKIMLGIPTYGHEYEVTVSPTGGYSYKKLWSLNPGYAHDIAKKHKVTPSRSHTGEMMVSYLPKGSIAHKTKLISPPKGTPTGERAVAQALAHAKATGHLVVVNVLWWSDAGAIESKLNYAKEVGLGGVSIFKVDGSADHKMWSLF